MEAGRFGVLSLPLDLLKARYFKDEDRGAAYLHFDRRSTYRHLAEHRQTLGRHELPTRLTLSAGELKDRVDVVVLDTAQDGDAATSQEAATAGDLGCGQAAAHERVNQAIAIVAGGDD